MYKKVEASLIRTLHEHYNIIWSPISGDRLIYTVPQSCMHSTPHTSGKQLHVWQQCCASLNWFMHALPHHNWSQICSIHFQNHDYLATENHLQGYIVEEYDTTIYLRMLFQSQTAGIRSTPGMGWGCKRFRKCFQATCHQTIDQPATSRFIVLEFQSGNQ